MASNIKGMDHGQMMAQHLDQLNMAKSDIKGGADINGKLNASKLKSAMCLNECLGMDSTTCP